MTCPVCGGPMPKTALRTCTFWCGLVALGRLTLADIQPMLRGA